MPKSDHVDAVQQGQTTYVWRCQFMDFIIVDL